MRIVVDAQLVAGYFRETERGEAPFYTASTSDLFVRLGNHDLAYVDDGGMIEAEYRNLVEREWFDAWYSDRLIDGDIVSLAAPMCRELIAALHTRCHFPKAGKDRYYVAVAKAIVDRGAGQAVIVSEDLDFYDPKAKASGAKTRAKILQDQSGPVARHLARSESIVMHTVAGHLAAGVA